MKICTKCNIRKPFAEFHKDITHKDGLRSHCKSCVRLYQNNNKEQIAIWDKQYRQKHKEQISIREKEYRQKNKEKIITYNKEYQEKNKKQLKTYRKSSKGKAIHKKAKIKYYTTLHGNLMRRWSNINQRCTNIKHKSFKYYGGRDIKNLFTSFDSFYNHIVYYLGYNTYNKIANLHIHRIKNDNHYIEGNICFLTIIKHKRKHKKYS